MKTELTEEARELGRVVHAALLKRGGVDLVRGAEDGVVDGVVVADDSDELLNELFDQLGVWDLRPRSSVDDAEAAAAVCRAAGRVALPLPVAERLSADPDGAYDALAVVGLTPRVNLVARTPRLRWAVIDITGRRSSVTQIGPPLGSKLGSLVSSVETGETVEEPHALPLALTLPCWTLLGMLDSALAMTRQHLLDRKQFGKPLASFQALQFRMADTATAIQGLEELVKYTLWSVTTRQPGALVDALACRTVALEAAETTFRTSHQMHGAMGFCDEVDLSWLSRHSQPLRRLPWGRSQTQAHLLEAMAGLPFDGLFGQGLVDTVPSLSSGPLVPTTT